MYYLLRSRYGDHPIRYIDRVKAESMARLLTFRTRIPYFVVAVEVPDARTA